MVVHGLCKVQESSQRRDRDILVRPMPVLWEQGLVRTLCLGLLRPLIKLGVPLFLIFDSYIFLCTPSYKLSLIARDDIAEAQFFAYDGVAHNIVHQNVVAVINQQRKEGGFPRFLTDIISKKFTFSIKITDDSFGEIKIRTYQIKSVLIDHEYQALRLRQQLAIEPSRSASLHVVPASTNVQQIQYTTPQIASASASQLTGAGASSVCSHYLLSVYCTVLLIYIPRYVLSLFAWLADTSAAIRVWWTTHRRSICTDTSTCIWARWHAHQNYAR